VFFEMAVLKFKGVIFDLSGTLVDDTKLHEAATVKVLARKGLNIDSAVFDEYFMGKSDLEAFEKISRDKSLHAEPSELLQEKKREYLNSFKTKAKKTWACALVKKAKEEGLRAALVSGITRDEVKAIVELLELQSFLDALVSCEDVEKGKPAPDPFLAAAAKLGLNATECVVVEDAPSGIKAAKAAGCACVAVTTTKNASELSKAGADFVAENAVQAKKFLFGAFGS
jgi:beta-phosphoglucomutase